MAKVRRANAYRQLERPYTRTSKYRAKSFIRAIPQRKVVKYDMGNLQRIQWPFTYYLKAKDSLQIRHNAIEAGRMTANRHLEKTAGKGNYRMKIRIYPHHILRENPLASGAGADRMSTGMKMSFGKPIGSAAQVRKGQIIFEVHTTKEHLMTVKKALNRAKNKFACSCAIELVENKPAKKAKAKATPKEAKPAPKEEKKEAPKTEAKQSEQSSDVHLSKAQIASVEPAKEE